MDRRQYFSGDEVLAMLDPDVEDGGLDDTFAPGSDDELGFLDDSEEEGDNVEQVVTG